MVFLKADKEDNKGPKQIFNYRGGGNGYTNTMFWLRTGIGVMKFVHPDDAMIITAMIMDGRIFVRKQNLLSVMQKCC